MESEIGEVGFALIPKLIDLVTIQHLLDDVVSLNHRAGTRTLLNEPIFRSLANSLAVLSPVRAILGNQAIPVRAILFDKTPETNWALGWHQDTKIALECRIETEGYSAWSEKEGIVHCQPPVEVLEQCLAVRLHLDECSEKNGPLRVIPGSHRHGIRSGLGDDERATAITLTADAGDAILMRPLLWHASSKAEVPAHRRVIHI